MNTVFPQPRETTQDSAREMGAKGQPCCGWRDSRQAVIPSYCCIVQEGRDSLNDASNHRPAAGLSDPMVPSGLTR